MKTLNVSVQSHIESQYITVHRPSQPLLDWLQCRERCRTNFFLVRTCYLFWEDHQIFSAYHVCCVLCSNKKTPIVFTLGFPFIAPPPYPHNKFCLQFFCVGGITITSGAGTILSLSLLSIQFAGIALFSKKFFA